MYYYPVSAVLTECLILSVVEQQDSYGYEISQTVKMVASIKESTLYPILRKLETGRISDNLFRGVPGKEAQVLFHHRGRTQSSGISEERVERIPRYHR